MPNILLRIRLKSCPRRIGAVPLHRAPCAKQSSTYPDLTCTLPVMPGISCRQGSEVLHESTGVLFLVKRWNGCTVRGSRLGVRPRMRPLLGCFVITELGCIGRWPISARCSSSKTGLPISPSKPTHELGYGIRISGARSVCLCLTGRTPLPLV